jgi:hypothetical protein
VNKDGSNDVSYEEDDNYDFQINYSLPSTINLNSVGVSESKKSDGAGNTGS